MRKPLSLFGIRRMQLLQVIKNAININHFKVWCTVCSLPLKRQLRKRTISIQSPKNASLLDKMAGYFSLQKIRDKFLFIMWVMDLTRLKPLKLRRMSTKQNLKYRANKSFGLRAQDKIIMSKACMLDLNINFVLKVKARRQMMMPRSNQRGIFASLTLQWLHLIKTLRMRRRI